MQFPFFENPSGGPKRGHGRVCPQLHSCAQLRSCPDSSGIDQLPYGYHCVHISVAHSLLTWSPTARFFLRSYCQQKEKKKRKEETISDNELPIPTN